MLSSRSPEGTPALKGVFGPQDEVIRDAEEPQARAAGAGTQTSAVAGTELLVQFCRPRGHPEISPVSSLL